MKDKNKEREKVPRTSNKKLTSNDEVKASITVHLIECLNNPITVSFPTVPLTLLVGAATIPPNV